VLLGAAIYTSVVVAIAHRQLAMILRARTAP
jgi:hypothetical protein